MGKYEEFYKIPGPPKVPIEQLTQLLRIVADGDLINKDDRDVLVESGYATRSCGFQVITAKGISYLYNNGHISP